MKVDNFEVFAVFFTRPISQLLQPMIRCLFLRVVVCLLGCGFRACGWNRLAWTLRTFSIFGLRALGVVGLNFSSRQLVSIGIGGAWRPIWPPKPPYLVSRQNLSYSLLALGAPDIFSFCYEHLWWHALVIYYIYGKVIRDWWCLLFYSFTSRDHLSSFQLVAFLLTIVCVRRFNVLAYFCSEHSQQGKICWSDRTRVTLCFQYFLHQTFLQHIFFTACIFIANVHVARIFTCHRQCWIAQRGGSFWFRCFSLF